jgi:hypothetical protein
MPIRLPAHVGGGMIDIAKFNAVLSAATVELQKLDSNFCGLVAVACSSEEEDDDGFWLHPMIHVETSLDMARLIERSVEVLEDYAVTRKAEAN